MMVNNVRDLRQSCEITKNQVISMTIEIVILICESYIHILMEVLRNHKKLVQWL